MVDFDMFLEWAKDRFGESNLKIRNTSHGVEICAHSYFARRQGIDDHKFHLWMSPSGGKSKHPEYGSYRCWLTDSMGSLVSLVAHLDHIEFDEAEELISGCASLRALEQKVADFFGTTEDEPVVAPILPPEGVPLPDYCFLIDGMSPGNRWKMRATNYLQDRKIPTDGLYVCTTDEKYGNRIIIPWRDQSGKITFWNGRTMSDHPKALRYAKPEKASQENTLFMTSWPRPGTKVYIMEGEFDAISIALAGLVGCACGGKYLSDTQIELLRGYEHVLVFDADKSGLLALMDVGNALLERGFTKISFVRPPKAYKDWNKMLQAHSPEVIRQYIQKFEKPYTTLTADFLRSKQL
jgi:hypothetical protein